VLFDFSTLPVDRIVFARATALSSDWAVLQHALARRWLRVEAQPLAAWSAWVRDAL